MSLQMQLHREAMARREKFFPAQKPQRPAKVEVVAGPVAAPEPEPAVSLFPTVKPPAVLTPRTLTEFVAAHYGMTAAHILGKTLCRVASTPRHIVFYLCRELLFKLSFPVMGRELNRNHSSIHHGWRKVRRLMRKDADLAHEVATYIEALKGLGHV